MLKWLYFAEHFRNAEAKNAKLFSISKHFLALLSMIEELLDTKAFRDATNYNEYEL